MAEFRAQEILERLKDWFTRLSVSMQANKVLKHQDANIRAEYFLRDLLNAVYGWNLENANSFITTDQDSYDLSDAEEGIAVQVTVTTGSSKIKKTLTSFVGTHDAMLPQLKFAYPLMNAPNSSAKFDKERKGFDFNVQRDRIDLITILEAIVPLPLEKQKAILNLVSDHLEPLGRAVHLGTDDVLETLIDVINFMTVTAPTKDISGREQDPAYELKRKRLEEHIAYLEQQYSIHAGLHSIAAQAREAIGYDQAIAAKIQAWLKGESISLLRKSAGDAGKAFDALVDSLLHQASQQGGKAQVTAVRFLLADEFQRCNVFPNP
jgi:hypothetical protein